MGLLDLLLPPSCGGCARFGALLCRACAASFRPPADPEDRFFAPDAAYAIGESLELTLAAFAYDGALRRALQRLKYGRVARLADPLARAAAGAFGELCLHADGAVVVPVPLHPARQRERGYNQALLLARALARPAGMRVGDVLVRSRVTTRQHKLDRAARARNLAGAFTPRRGVAVPREVVLVDDILTTGATLEACAMVLRRAGVARIHGFAIAREV